jgi:GTPase
MANREPPRARRKRGDETPPEPDATRRIAGTVAVVGYPNVGKSTLVNRLTGRRDTVVHQQPGVTRDRKELFCEWNGEVFRIVDTGGIDVSSDDPIIRQVADQARIAIAEADLAVFVVDAQAGVTAGDQEVAQLLRRAPIAVLVVANKIDNPRAETLMKSSLYELGLGEPFAISALHGHNTGDLLDRILELLTSVAADHQERVSNEIGVAILGRPNVGKSSLVNALVGQPRVIVSDVPGTTRDAVDTRLQVGDTTFRLIDTAGLRRKRKHRQEVEYWSQQRALAAAQRADVALVVIDAAEGVTDQDLHVADEARIAGCATIIVITKWDIQEVDLDALRVRLATKLKQRPLVVTTSSVTRRGLTRLLRSIEEIYERYTSRISTADLNKVLGDATARQPSPLVHGRRLKVLYGAQVQTRPPRFRVTINDRRLIKADYAYYLENRIREAAGLDACPVIIDFVARA